MKCFPKPSSDGVFSGQEVWSISLHFAFKTSLDFSFLSPPPWTRFIIPLDQQFVFCSLSTPNLMTPNFTLRTVQWQDAQQCCCCILFRPWVAESRRHSCAWAWWVGEAVEWVGKGCRCLLSGRLVNECVSVVAFKWVVSCASSLIPKFNCIYDFVWFSFSASPHSSHRYR